MRFYQILVRSGVVTTLILLSLAFGYVFVTNWKVYEISLITKGLETSGEPRRDRKSSKTEPGTNKVLLSKNLVSAVVAPLTSKASHTITINVQAPEEGEEPTLCEVIHHTDSDNVTHNMVV